MTKNQKEKIRQAWQSLLTTIEKELAWALTGHDIYKEVRNIVRKNEKTRSPVLFWKWMRENYLDSASMRIRRLNDADKGMLSLKRLITDIKENHEAITRQEYVSEYSKRMQKEGFADRDFEIFGDRRSSTISIKRINRDIEHLDKQTQIIRKYTDKWLAHAKSNRHNEPIPTLRDLEKALDAIDNICMKYHLLLTRGGMRTCKPIITYDWKEPLRHPWIENKQKNEY